MARYDLESLLDDIVAACKDSSTGINARLTAISAEKADGIDLGSIDPAAYFIQDLNSEQANFNPYVLVWYMGLTGAEDGLPGFTKTQVDLNVSIVFADQGAHNKASRMAFRYLRALTEVIEGLFASIPQAGKLQVVDQNVIPARLLNSSRGERATGILIRADLA